MKTTYQLKLEKTIRLLANDLNNGLADRAALQEYYDLCEELEDYKKQTSDENKADNDKDSI